MPRNRFPARTELTATATRALWGMRFFQWCREAFSEKEARLKHYYEGTRRFDTGGEHKGDLADGALEAAAGPPSLRSGRTAFFFLVALVVLVLMYGGTIFGLYALSACSVHTLVTATGGWDTVELRFADLALGAASDKGVSKED